MLWRVAVWQVPWLLAAIDEIHQFLVPGRTGSVGDVGIDVLGAWLGLAVWRRWSTYGGGA